MKYLVHLIFGVIFGIILTKGEVISWFRIQEMFRFQSFHMYGVIGSAIFVGAISIFLIKKFKVKTFSGEEINPVPKPVMRYANFTGGLIFGLGWALTGACPAPIYALIGNGYLVFIVVLIFAYMGAYTYALVKNKLPH